MARFRGHCKATMLNLAAEVLMTHPFDMTFQFVGGDLDQVPKYAENIIAGVGIAMLNWARLEQQLDALLISVNKPDHATKSYTQTPSINFKKKIDMFETWFVHDPRFKNQHDRAARLVKSFKLAVDDRNLLAHSNVQKFIEGPPVRMIVLKTIINSDKLIIERGEWTETAIFGLAKDFNNLSHGLYTISEEVLRPDFIDALRVRSN
jgi:hypothetical protein